jgi:hypothetical protein
MIKTITQKTLAEKIAKLSGTIIAGLQTLTDAKAKTNPIGKILKQSRFVGFIGANYQSAVEREATRQGVDASEFQGEKLPWGKWLVPNKLIEHKGKLYLRTQFTPRQRPNKVIYRNETGQFLSKETILPYLPPVRESAKQQDIGLEKTIQVRTFSFDSIQKIRLQGVTYRVAA